jgi:hypothetical protein
MHLVLPFGNGLIIWKILQSKELLSMELSAQTKMCAQTIVQFVFHEGNNVKYPFVFN